MIVVEIKVPALDKIYDFQMDENIPLCEIRKEIAEMICRKEQYTMQGEEKDLLMWDALRESRLQMEKTAYENGLKTGNRILLV